MAQEREEVERYMNEHALEAQLNMVVNDVVQERPADPFTEMAAQLTQRSAHAGEILDVHSEEVLSGGGLPALVVTLTTVHGEFRASTATGPRDGDPKRFRGQGMRKAAEAVAHLARPKLVGQKLDQRNIDAFLLEEEQLPANAVLALSMACSRAVAAAGSMPLHEALAELAGVSDPCIPVPVVGMINGADLAASPCPVREIAIAPLAAETLGDAIDAAFEFEHLLRSQLEQAGFRAVNVGSMGALAPPVESVEDALKYMLLAKQVAGSEAASFGIDAGAEILADAPTSSSSLGGANELDGDGEPGGGGGGDGGGVGGEEDEDGEADKEGGELEGSEQTTLYDIAKFNHAVSASRKTSEELIDLYIAWLTQFPVHYLEGQFHPNDGPGRLKFKERLDAEVRRTQAQAEAGLEEGQDADAGDQDAPDEPVIPFEPVGGDDSCLVQLMTGVDCATADALDECCSNQLLNTFVLTLSRGKTVSGCVDLAAKARSLGMAVVASVERNTPETTDDFIAHLAVGTKAGQFRGGGLNRGEFGDKYNALLKIASATGLPYAKGKFRNFHS